ncbi:chaplin [Streptomyces sp. RS10V-4]|uniref:chaplin n=1 Tax=Streptomyces rhizoryzae TaxID=2932493 RepID=UPI002005B70F|nr:chaplin [Streptomyces rhizoryzae]MCK7624230.1 chaplin [Streptomyces rhizoryzae]
MKFVSKAVVLSAAAGIAVVGGAGVAGAHGHGGASAAGGAVGSPGVISGNLIQIPVDVPINACGNSVNIVGLLNPAFGNTCINA